MKKINLYNLYYIFIFGSIVGWVIEGFWTLLKKGILLNHSALVIGPFNIVYGIGAVILTILLVKFKDKSIFKIFLIGFIGGSILEYLMSLGMELIIGFSAWDYSRKFLNINGRICLVYSMFWGILGLAWIKMFYPPIIKFIENINVKVGRIVIICLSVFLLFDFCLTMSAVNRARALDKGIEPSNNYEKFLDKTFNSAYLKNMYNNTWK